MLKEGFVKLSPEGCSGHPTDSEEGAAERSGSREMRGTGGEGLLPAPAGQESCPQVQAGEEWA